MFCERGATARGAVAAASLPQAYGQISIDSIRYQPIFRYERIMISVLDFDVLDSNDELGGTVLYLRGTSLLPLCGTVCLFPTYLNVLVRLSPAYWEEGRVGGRERGIERATKMQPAR